jgi:hypothetical protein
VVKDKDTTTGWHCLIYSHKYNYTYSHRHRETQIKASDIYTATNTATGKATVTVTATNQATGTVAVSNVATYTATDTVTAPNTATDRHSWRYSVNLFQIHPTYLTAWPSLLNNISEAAR